MRRAVLSFLLTLVLTSCVAPPGDAPPPRALPVTVAPPPATAPALPVGPGAVEPGSWSYARTTGGSIARFGADGATAFAIECDAASQAILLRLFRTNPSAPATTAVLRASTTLKTVPVSGGGAFGTARFAPRDALLDALGFSRGRFGVAIDGRESWLPAWPEFMHVVEDCRA